MKKFWKKFCQILIVKISASEPSIEKIFKKFEAAVDEKTAAQKPKKIQKKKLDDCGFYQSS